MANTFFKKFGQIHFNGFIMKMSKHTHSVSLCIAIDIDRFNFLNFTNYNVLKHSTKT